MSEQVIIIKKIKIKTELGTIHGFLESKNNTNYCIKANAVKYSSLLHYIFRSDIKLLYNNIMFGVDVLTVYGTSNIVIINLRYLYDHKIPGEF